MDIDAAIAINRFGLGRRPAEPVPANPRDWLRGQLDGPDQTPLPAGIAQDQCSSADALALVQTQLQSLKMAKQATQGQASGAAIQDPPARAHPVGDRAKQEVHALIANAVLTPTPFRERLVWFWANHFTIAARSLVPSACAGAYVREAIRPHVTGRFSDMLLAVMRHPAMLAYLDQVESVGPDSVLGERKHRGLNENLARESLELHTLTPASGYSQADVTNYAKILTGWSIELHDAPRGFKFRPRLHEPGEINVMGRVWPEGEAGGLAILAWLGTHPATYRHIAEKLVRHVVADEPPRDDVRRIEAVLRDTKGDLGAASAALIELRGAWVPGAKLRTPQEFVIACLRVTGAEPEQDTQFNNAKLGAMMAGLGQGVFQAPFPIGWPDRAADWAGPEAMLQRVDFAYGLAARQEGTDPEALGHAALGPLLSQATLSQIRGAGSRRDALTLLLASPDFQRR